MAISNLQTATNKTSISAVTSLVTNFASNTTAGSIILALVCTNSATASISVSDGGSNSYSQVNSLGIDTGTGPAFSAAGTLALYWAYNPTGGFKAVTASFGSAVNVNVILAEYAGLASSPLDAHTVTNLDNATSPFTSAPINTAGDYELLFAYYGSVATGAIPTAGSGFGNLVSNRNFSVVLTSAIEDRITSGAGSYSGVFNGTGGSGIDVGVGIAAFKVNPFFFNRYVLNRRAQ